MQPQPQPNAFEPKQEHKDDPLLIALETMGVSAFLDLETALHADLTELDKQKQERIQRYRTERAALLEQLRAKANS